MLNRVKRMYDSKDLKEKVEILAVGMSAAVFAGLCVTNNFIETNHEAATDAFHTAVAEGNMEYVYGLHDGLAEAGATIDADLADDIHTKRLDRNRLAAYIFTPVYKAGYESGINGEYDAEDLAALNAITDDYPEVMREIAQQLTDALNQDGMDPQKASRIGAHMTMQAVLDAGQSKYYVGAIKEETDYATYEVYLSELSDEIATSMAPQINAGLISKAGASYMNYLADRKDGRFFFSENGNEMIIGFKSRAIKIGMVDMIWDPMGGPPHVTMSKNFTISNGRYSKVTLPVDDPFTEIATSIEISEDAVELSRLDRDDSPDTF